VNRTDLQKLAKDRIGDAKALLAARRWAFAYYAVGYSVECALKACIAKQVKAEDFPDKGLAEKSYTHNLDNLLVVARLKVDLDAAMKLDADLAKNWETVRAWSEASRYAHTKREEAQELYDAITDKKHGVFAWISSRW
jgi:hypothetical protein